METPVESAAGYFPTAIEYSTCRSQGACPGDRARVRPCIGRVTGGTVMTLFRRRPSHVSGEVELAIAAGVRTRIDEVRARRRMQHDGLRRRRLRGLVAEREVDANRRRDRGNCTRSSFAAMRLRRCFSRRRLRAPSGPTVVNFSGCVAPARVEAPPAPHNKSLNDDRIRRRHHHRRHRRGACPGLH